MEGRGAVALRRRALTHIPDWALMTPYGHDAGPSLGARPRTPSSGLDAFCPQQASEGPAPKLH